MRRLYRILKGACETDNMLMQHRSEHAVTGNLTQIIGYTQAMVASHRRTPSENHANMSTK